MELALDSIAAISSVNFFRWVTRSFNDLVTHQFCITRAANVQKTTMNYNLAHARHNYCSCLILSRHLSCLYRPLGHFDNITTVTHLCRSSASAIHDMILVHYAISFGPSSSNLSLRSSLKRGGDKMRLWRTLTVV